MKKLRDEGRIADFVGECLNVGAKVVDKLDLFKHDGLLSVLPAGKIISFIIKNAIIIKNPDEAFRKLFSFAYFITYTDALSKLGIEQDFTPDEIKSLKDVFSSQKYLAQPDDDSLFSTSDIKKDLDEYYQKISERNNYDSEKIKTYIDEYLKINFLYLLEKLPTTYSTYKKRIGEESFKQSFEKEKLHLYLKESQNLFTESINCSEQDYSLCDIYIEPYFEIHRCCFKDEALNEYSMEDNAFIKPQSNLSLYSYIESIIKDREAIKLKYQQYNLIILLGNPGQGKSSFCKKILFNYNIDFFQYKKVFYFPMRNRVFSKDFVNKPFEKIISSFKERLKQSESNNNVFVNSLLLLDGFDEMDFEDGKNLSEINKFLKALLNEIKKINGLKIIITSRFGYIEPEKLKNAQILILRIKDFDSDQQDEFLTNKLNQKIDLDHCDESLRELISNPMLLYLTFKNDLFTKGSPDAYYEVLFENLFERFYENEEFRYYFFYQENGSHKKELLESIRQIAHKLYSTGKDRINKTELRNIQKELSLYKDSKCDIIPIGSLFFFRSVYNDNKPCLTFKHDTLYHYLIAEYIWLIIKLKFLEKQKISQSSYVIEQGKDALKEISELFSNRLLPLKVVEFLILFINNEEESLKNELLSRLQQFFSFFLEKGFLSEYSAEEVLNPFDLSRNTFYGFMIIYSHLSKTNDFSDIQENNYSYFDLILDVLLSTENITFKEANLNHIRFTAKRLENLNFEDAKLCRADFSSGVLNDINFSRANLSESVFRDAKLSEIDFKGANLTEANLSGLTLRGVSFEDVTMKNANLEETNLRDCSIIDSDFSDVILDEADLEGSELENVDLSKAEFNNANLSQTTLSKVNFSKAKLRKTKLIDAVISNDTIFDGASLDEVEMDEQNYHILSERYSEISGRFKNGKVFVSMKNP